MKLLFDENLSPQLPRLLQDLYPESRQSRRDLNLGPDYGIWDYAKDYGFVIVSKDRDFRILSERYGHPPKVILILLGNCPVADIVTLLRENYLALMAFEQDNNLAIVSLP